MQKFGKPLGRSVGVRIAIVLAAAGVCCIVASVLVAYLIADHSSSDSSPSAVTAIGLASIGILAAALGLLAFAGTVLARFAHTRWLRHRAAGTS